MSWPPPIGEPLRLANDAYGVNEKLVSYSLNLDHRDGGPKARLFRSILGITAADVDYLARALHDGLASRPVRATRDNPPHGVLCEVRIEVRGRAERAGRTATVVTVWEVWHEDDPPRLVTAYIRA